MSDTKTIIIGKLTEAESEALRFTARVRRALLSVDRAKRFYFRDRELAAAKRASLDLSRALAELRKSPYKQ